MDWREIQGIGRVALGQFSPGEVAGITGLSADLQRVWRRRGHLPARTGSHASFDARDVAALAVRHDLARMGFAPPDTVEIGRLAAPIVLYFALLSSDGAAHLQGRFKRIAQITQRLTDDEKLAMVISEVRKPWRYVLITDPPAWEFVGDAAATLSEERFPAMLVLDLALIGQRLVIENPKPLFLIDVAG